MISVSDITKHNIERSVFITHVFLLFWLTKKYCARVTVSWVWRTIQNNNLRVKSKRNSSFKSSTPEVWYTDYLSGNSFKLTCNTFTKHLLPWQPNKQFILHFITFYIIAIHESITESNWKSAESLLFTLCFSHIKNRFILIKSYSRTQQVPTSTEMIQNISNTEWMNESNRQGFLSEFWLVLIICWQTNLNSQVII